MRKDMDAWAVEKWCTGLEPGSPVAVFKTRLLTTEDAGANRLPPPEDFVCFGKIVRKIAFYWLVDVGSELLGGRCLCVGVGTAWSADDFCIRPTDFEDFKPDYSARNNSTGVEGT